MSTFRRSLTMCASFLLALTTAAYAGNDESTELTWYLPKDVTYDASVPTPASVLGWEVGTWHVRHDQLLQWYRELAEFSPRMTLETYGHTHEQRPLILATVSSPANLARIDEIREAHVASVLSGAETDSGPTIVWMGYSVHGNESSGSNAALLLAYHLAAAQGRSFDEFLEKTVILIDPCVNPDGLSRFAHWANSNRGMALVDDPNNREHREGWPSGRTNHYWFDLNRDWLLATHPESQGRLVKFHEWMPCVLTDYHEMGTDSTYFFQPGIPSRQNPLTPERNLELTRGIAAFHAAALDEIGSLYYTEESFDDFYYGKGSTYPDINGCIGILFEQASSRGHLQENSFGGISFPFTIRNQLTTSLSTLRAAHEMGDQLGGYQREFYRSAISEADQHEVRAYVFGAPEDPERTQRLARLLQRHQIQVHHLGRELVIEGEGEDKSSFDPNFSFLVRLKQPQYRLIRALFETRTSWPDNTFYDVSSWTLPLSFDVPAQALSTETFSEELVGAVVDRDMQRTAEVESTRSPVAWIFEWHNYNAPRALQRLLEAGVRARVATRCFTSKTASGTYEFDYGTIVVPIGVQSVDAVELRALMDTVAKDGIKVHAAISGLTPEGVDLGSGSLRPVEEPKPVMIVGSSTSSYEAGEAWHYLDKRLDMALSMVEASTLSSLDLARYTHVIMVNGASSGVDESGSSRLAAWVRSGGVLITTKSSAVWAANEYLENAEEEASEEPSDHKEGSDEEEESEQDELPEEQTTDQTYEDYEDLRAVQRIAGTIFRTRLDRTHPLAFGYVRDQLPVFRNFSELLPEGTDPFGTPVRYTDDPLISGFASPENTELIAGSPAVRAARMGRGTVICMIDNPNFRGVWYGTNKLFANAIFFGGAIKRTGALAEKGSSSEGHQH